MVRRFAANGGNWQFTQYKIHWRKSTKYTFQLNSAITPFPWQIRIFFRVELDRPIHKELNDTKFYIIWLLLMSAIFENKKNDNVWESIGENEELLHPLWILSKNQSLISLFHDLRTENN